MSVEKCFSEAIKEAKKNRSEIRNLHGAIALKGRKIVGRGCNSSEPNVFSSYGGSYYGCNTHAEVSALTETLKETVDRFRGQRVNPRKKGKQCILFEKENRYLCGSNMPIQRRICNKNVKALSSLYPSDESHWS